MEITYASSDCVPSSAAVRKLSSTSRTVGDTGMLCGTSGRREESSLASHSTRFASSQPLNDPRPRYVVTASSASVCRGASCRMSSFSSARPKQATRRTRSARRPSAMAPAPHACSDS